MRSLQMPRVLVVEDDPKMRAFFAASVSACKDLTLLASVGTVAEAKSWLNDHAVDVLLTDLGLPDGSGLEVIRYAIARNPRCEPLVISMFGDENNVLSCIEAGALGYIHKDSAPDTIAQSILDMRGGASPISPLIARRVLSKYRSDHVKRAPATTMAQGAPGKINDVIKDLDAQLHRGLLSPREQDILALIARGFSYAEIAGLQALSVHTVQGHIKHLYGKLSVHSKSEAVFEASRMGLLNA
jgi:DNA-binding NarL/FixJ family response regulator